MSYDGAFGFVGLYIVQSGRRGQGYGMPLWQRAMARLAGHNIGLDGVIAQQDNYRKPGFALAYRNIRYQGQGGGDAPDLRELVALPSVEVVADYERGLFPAPRAAFLRAWLTLPESHGAAYVDHEKWHGYGVARRCRVGWKVGPLFADSPDVAEALLASLAAKNLFTIS
ncbi:hypothetical protein [Crenobacter cavernae]|uniref:YitH/HolE acetyltransferase (GNAT) domain-containing protein n=1 Tax=Crenobacter cavernae TaxID=2290923 RepID=A0A345Y8L1_9NEIS|nr:hypothetical protein [Crenobacter cavernae]AXK40263.1 hypothetical protein DWG20_12930 [Crenobacter cavernae]